MVKSATKLDILLRFIKPPQILEVHTLFISVCVCVCFFKTHLLQQSLLSKTVKMLQRFKLPGKGFFKFFLAYLRVMGPPQTLSTILQR